MEIMKICEKKEKKHGIEKMTRWRKCEGTQNRKLKRWRDGGMVRKDRIGDMKHQKGHKDNEETW